MPDEGKSKLDYFIERTDKRLDDVADKLDRLCKFGIIVVILCVALSPTGEKILELVPKFMELTAAAGKAP